MEHNTFFQSASFDEVLDDLSCRFIVNIPSEELVSVPRICFQVEQAHWFYEDFVREQNPHHLPSLSLRKFSKCIFDHCPLLWQYSGSHEKEFEDFLKYKQRVPVLGGILLDENWEKCILVKAWKGGSWSFPRGKINKDEPDIDCAIREVYEETGYDISSLILPDAFIELQIKEQRVKLYIIPGVPTNTPMFPQTRKEISDIGWIHLVDLPGYSKRDKQANPGIKLYMVTPFLSGLRRWIAQNRYKKGGLISVEKDGLEDVIQDEVVQNGSANDLIAMLRRQKTSDQRVDLLGMLRNGNTTVQIPYYEPPHQEHHDPSMHGDLYHALHQTGSAPPLSDLSQFSPKMEPTLDATQQPGESIESPPPVMDQGDPSHMARRQSLLNILMGRPVTNSSPLGDNKSHQRTASQPPNASPLQIQRPQRVDSPKSEHQQSLLSAFESPQTSMTAPLTSSQSTATHKNALLSMLKSPPVTYTGPSSSLQTTLPSTPKSPATSSVQSPTASTHQNALLATLKMSPKPMPSPMLSKPKEQPSTKPSSATDSLQTSDNSTHQNALLSALRTPKVSDTLPLTGHQTSLLSMLKSSHTQETPPTENPVTATIGDKLQLPPLPLVQSSSVNPSVPAPTMEHPSSYVLGSMNFQIPPTTPSVPQLSPFSELKSPELPSTSPNLTTEHHSSLLNAIKASSIPPEKHASSLLSVLKGSVTEPPPTEKKEGEDKRPQEVTNIHMESLLRKLRSPSTSPAVEKTVPPAVTYESTKKSTDSDDLETKSVVPQEPTVSEKNEILTGKVAAPSHVNSLLFTLKGQMDKPTGLSLSATSSTPVQTSPPTALTGVSTNHDVDRGEQITIDPHPSGIQVTDLPDSKHNPEEIVLSNHSTSSYLEASNIQSTSAQVIVPTKFPHPFPKPATPSAPPPSLTEPSSKLSLKGPKVNFSPASQVGNRTKFHYSTVPRGRKEVQQPAPRTEPKTNGTIDLSKVTLLRRPAEQAKLTGNTGAIHTEKGDITVLERPAEKRPQETASAPTKPTGENTPESPLGIEFPFKKRTPSKSAHASPTSPTMATRANSQGLLTLLKGPPVHTAKASVHTEDNATLETKSAGAESGDDRIKALLKAFSPRKQDLSVSDGRDITASRPVPEVQPEDSDEPKQLGAEREMKLVAMLEKALARGVPS